jgi:starch-binding outer membrane protein, SusD/RagB family
MKILRILTLAIISTFAITSCDVLNVEPTQSITAEGAIQTPSDLERALMGCYNGLQSADYYGRNFLVLPDLAADNLDWRGTSQDYGVINNNVPSPDLFLIEGIWASIYSMINGANNAIYYLPNVENLSENAHDNFLGELMFIRALGYFDLVRTFGGVPLRTLPTLEAGDGLHVARTPANDVIDFIIEELEDAIELISNTQKGRATQLAAKALLARVYLFAEEYSNAWTLANEVILSNDYSLVTNYEELYLNPHSAESIFEIDFNEQDGNRLAQYFAPSPAGRYEFGPYDSFIDLYDTNDERFNASIDTSKAESPAVIKYKDVQQGSDNVIVLRLAEMYLIRAEAEANSTSPNIANVQADIDAVRIRANIGGTSATTINQLKDEILNQRRFEFAFEGHRWFDLVRTGKAIEMLENVNSEYQLLFPIPQSEILSNNAIKPEDQNPGY